MNFQWQNMFISTNNVGISYILKISAGSEILWLFLHFHNCMHNRGYYFKPANDFFFYSQNSNLWSCHAFHVLEHIHPPIPAPALSFLVQVAEITEELATLPKRAQLAAAFITYLSAAPEGLRKTCLEEWAKSACLESLYLVIHVLKFQYTKTVFFDKWGKCSIS